ncbi:4Fe-4S ferredoxin [candidate division WOR-1 bacterium RIFOXYA12_FULL_43_27]|uniref:Ferredoxin n=1 Tax=candidate division WOR-1 bacterium RIFOXYC2_FULL_46_14 TaxID=1802587 RepID=A0A1F4U6F4_UNCSA|nr:MAG: 4Fe-4S ferredoxin [candidate division WOR-1 bacterium RIFOXYA12_FULL_43_27]OGC20618.1 MAG: 4Fe-4S ferredoxin [candidate division WOR-1 bacterium RIFOXYB2_FULL_46_45]OGC31645.1 MAG: 4Fe-4S ferredoxin [candidate division WOR-1 bacterium RIFOXYA2_FULL_46_56]OGC40459.1 MAG: 4Fe-4S ferredoxin [candidate division WOR-1 bacterium RIFOXYC2_FULL_46_14]
MAIINVVVEDGCTGCGLCEQIAPEVFEVSDIAKVKDGVVVSQFESQIKEAADSCPVSVIKIS